MRKILVSARDHPDIDYYEYRFLNSPTASKLTETLWRQTYYEVFGDDAILSLGPELERLDMSDFGIFGTSYVVEPILLPVVADGSIRELKHIRGFIMPEGKRKPVVSYRDRVEKAVANEAHLENANLRILPQALTSFLRPKVYSSLDDVEKIQAEDVELAPQDQEKLTGFLRSANETILVLLESIESNPEARKVLREIVPEVIFNGLKDLLSHPSGLEVVVKSSLFPADGMVERKGERVCVSLNEQILGDPNRLLGTYVHEVAHYLTEAKDYTLDFQRFLTILAIGAKMPVGHRFSSFLTRDIITDLVRRKL
jgi:hypothetical protein